MSYSTYAHHKPDGSIFYIGKGSHKRAYSCSGRNVVWQRTVKKHGGFSVSVLADWPTEEEAFEHEIFLIDTFREMGYVLANIAAGGMGATGSRHTEEHKEKMSAFMKASNPMSDPALRKKQRDSLTIAMRRPEVRAHQSKVRMGKPLPEAHIASLKLCHPMRPCVVNGVEYVSLMEASRVIGVRHGTLFRWLNNPAVKHNSKFKHIIETRWL